ncbi:MAG: hypothetical protein K0S12_1510, partial [Bacteroidetes bacterium]|nr:hypothetical protein [Bacteroidota bacterium]
MRLRFLVPLLLLGLGLSGQNNTSAEYKTAEQQIHEFMKEWNIPGGSVSITKNGKVIYNKGFGFSDINRQQPAKADDLYRIASVSKPITSIAVMKLVEEGKLSLNDTVFGKGKILDDPYYLKVISDSRAYAITVKHLLEHTSGWDRSKPCDGYSHSDPAFFPLHVTEVENEPNPVGDSTLIRFSLRKGLHHTPGTYFSYSNVGYLVLGKVIEKVSGMNYETYLQKKIFSPLAIKDIHLGKNLLKDKYSRETEYACNDVTNSCYGNDVRVPWQYGGFNLEAMNAHGGWIASAGDLTKLLLAVDGFKTSPDILRASSVELMSQPGSVNPAYAAGWAVNGKNNWWHTGSLDGSASFVCRTNNGYTWAFLFNSRADNSSAFWKALDRLPWNCV